MSRRLLGRHASSPGDLTQAAFRQFREGLYRYLLRKLRNAEHAEDLTQEVYLRLLRTAERRLVRNPQAYVFGIAFNVLYEFRLHEDQVPVAYDSQAAVRASERLADESASLQDNLEQRSKESWLDEILGRLSPMQRAVLLMAKRKGLAHAEIAQELGISIGTVRKHLARAVKQCRESFHD